MYILLNDVEIFTLKQLPKSIVAIPRHGLGDILYTCLCLQKLNTFFRFSRIVIFAPKYASELIGLFKFIHIPLYPRFLHWKKGLNTNLLNEVYFFVNLLKMRESYTFSLINDIFDDFIFKVFLNGKPINTSIGNYHAVATRGIRAKINNFFQYNFKCKVNPKHILHRFIISCSFLNLGRNYNLSFYKNASSFYMQYKNTRLEQKRYCVFLPDAANKNRCVDLKYFQSFINTNTNTLVISKYKSLVCKTYKYPALKRLALLFKKANLVVTSDSFTAHFAAIYRPRYIVVFYNSIFAKEQPWTRWGLPLSNAYHFCDNAFYQLDSSFASRKVYNIPSIIRRCFSNYN